MKNKISGSIILAFVTLHGVAQQFITKGTIEFEVTTNVKKTMSNESFLDELKATIPTFKIAYYNYTFANNKSLYRFDHYDEKKAKVPEFLRENEDENLWFNDFTTGQSFTQKTRFGSVFSIKDSIKNIQWKITNESRVIAGFNCRKAVGKIFDSVYVFAFYTDEIAISGGPCTINGLPGMILGITIPRLYTSMLATKLMVNDVNESIIKPVTAKKYYTAKELKAVLDERTKDFTSDDDDDKDWLHRMYWIMLL